MQTIKYRWSGFAIFALLLLGLFLLPSCEKEEMNTGIALHSFGPSPALRGGELRFIGQNLGEVTAVIFPGVTGGTIQVTDIITVNEREIKVMIPQDAGVGIVTLVTASGEIKTITPLTFSEPISITNVSPLKVKAGETLTIEGDYLNLIKRVIFFDNVAVEASDFLPGQTRKKLQVTVPAEAQSGKIIISNAEEMPIEVYSDAAVEVVLPSVAATADLTGKKPGEVIDIAGEDLDLVVSLFMPNGDEVPFEVIETEAGEAIRFTLPANMTDGVVIVLPASGVEVAIANIGLALPASVVATPAEDLRAGDLITLEGLNMELITSLTFPGVTETVEPESQTATEVTVTMPDAATSGNLLLNTGSGVSVEVAIETLKPTFTAYENSTVPLGDNVVITGENLDLVAKVQFTGGAEVEVSSTSPGSLVVAMPTMNVENGVLTLFMANGESVEIESLTIEAPQFAYFPVLPGEEEEPNKGGTVMSIGITNGDKLTGVEVDGTAVQYILNNDLLFFEIPQLANANSKVKLISSNGEIIYSIAFIPATDVEIVIFNTLTDLGAWDEPRVYIPASEFERDIPADAKMKIYFAQKEAWGQVQINDGNWSNAGIVFPELGGPTLTTDNAGGKDAKEIELTLTPELVQRFRDNNGIVMQGSDWIISKVSITYKVSLETTVWTGDVDLGNWSVNYEVKPPSIFLDAGVKAGMKLRLYVDTYGDEQKVQLFNGHWEGIYGDIAIEPTNSEVWSGDVITLPIDAAIAANLREYIDWGYCLIVQGQNCVLKKITIE
ncbi:MAG: hypothetical protein ITG04_12885 [Proteiniphilum sp.]|jgi:hypothetical protein|nr:hypothetical protein [Proteiniphilum sp.]NLY25614.1 hypothetical protein [Bacteroidales bacterium]